MTSEQIAPMKNDAFGQALMDCYLGKAKTYYIERDDNYLDEGDLKVYFSEYQDWTEMD